MGVERVACDQTLAMAYPIESAHLSGAAICESASGRQLKASSRLRPHDTDRHVVAASAQATTAAVHLARRDRSGRGRLAA